MGNKNDLGTSVDSQQQTQSTAQRASPSSDSSNTERRAMTYEQLAERRSTPRSKTPFYKVMLGLNIFGWVGMVVVRCVWQSIRIKSIGSIM